MAKLAEKYYTVPEVAEMFQCSIDTVRHWIRTGRLERVKLGRLVRITPEQLQRFMQENAAPEYEKTDIVQ